MSRLRGPKVLTWRAASPDWSPIEHIWDDCRGRCQQPILMICVPKCIQRGITFLRQPLITSLIAAKVCKRVDFCAWRSYSILNKSRCFVYFVSIFLSFAYYYHVYQSCDFHHSKTFPSRCCNFNVEECNIQRWPASLSIDHIHLWANCHKYIPGSRDSLLYRKSQWCYRQFPFSISHSSRACTQIFS